MRQNALPHGILQNLENDCILFIPTHFDSVKHAVGSLGYAGEEMSEVCCIFSSFLGDIFRKPTLGA
jgi:hypothetical protein